MAAATSATPAQWHFMDTLLPSAVASALPCDSQSVNAGAIANTNAARIITTPRTVFMTSSIREYDRPHTLESRPQLDMGGLN